MLSPDLVPKTPAPNLIRHIACRTRIATLAVLIVSAYLSQSFYRVGAAEIHTGTESRPAGFADIVAKVKPAVIAVTVKLEDVEVKDAGEPDGPSQSTPFSENSPLHRYFFGSPKRQPRSAPNQAIEMALGSGFFISPDGYAVTNDHVVQHGVSFMVATEDGPTYRAKVVGTDLRTDLALLKVNGRNDFPYVKLADHEPRISDWVIAVGNPYGLGAPLPQASCRRWAAGSTLTLMTISFSSTHRSTKAIPEARVLTWMGRSSGSTPRSSRPPVVLSELGLLSRPRR